MSLVVEGLSFAYPGQTLIFEQAELVCRKSEITAVVGANGAGKSTLIRLVLGTLRADAGSLCWDGGPIENLMQEPGLLASLAQNPVVYKHLSVRESLLLWEKVATYHDRKPWRSPDELMALFHLEPWASSLVRELSGGTKQRLCLAQLFLSSPELLILDEPITGLDLLEQLSWFSFLKNYVDSSKATVVLISHSFEEIQSLADKAFLIDQRKMTDLGSQRDTWKEQVQLAWKV